MAPPSAPTLTFACELESPQLPLVFGDDEVLNALGGLGARVALALPDARPERADAVRALNAAGIPAVAWLLAAEDDGYYFNLDNPPAAKASYDAFRDWSRLEGLEWEAIAFDFEPSKQELTRAFSGGRRYLLRDVGRRLVDPHRVPEGTRAYSELVDRIHADGYRIDSYRFPFSLDDDQRSHFVHRLMNEPRCATDRDVHMLYTSFVGPAGPAILASYGRDADGIAVGSTGGLDAGEQAGAKGPTSPLGWEELSRDLRLARSFTDHITIYSLEGCVAQDMLSRLDGFDWDSPPADVSATAVATVDAVRALLRNAARVADVMGQGRL